MNQPIDFSQFDKNPFEEIVNSAKSQGQPSAQPAQQPQPQGQPGGPMAGKMMKTPPNQLDYGAVGGTTPALTGALQSMQKFIGETQDATEIAIGRTIITLLTKLIQADQQKQTAQLPQGQPGQGSPTPQGQ